MDGAEGLLPDDEGEVLISAIEHFSYCPRQCALIHVERTFDENVFTIRGRLVHERVDMGEDTTRPGLRVMRGLPLWSQRLGLRGKADVVEFREEGPYPVEYKAGRPQAIHPNLQLCAQALCLEEMLGVAVPKGAVFYSAVRRRQEVEFGDALRRKTLEAIAGVRALLRSQRLPEAANDARCRNCSLANSCLPTVVGEPERLRGLQSSLFRPLEVGDRDA